MHVTLQKGNSKMDGIVVGIEMERRPRAAKVFVTLCTFENLSDISTL